MSGPLGVALAQIDVVVGDVTGNAGKIVGWARRAVDAGAGLIVFPELALSGYPPEDLLLKKHFLAENRAALERVAADLGDLPAAVVVGYPEAGEHAVYNSLAVLHGGAIAGRYRKMLLPNYGVFDEQRYFASGDRAALLDVNGIGVGLTICEDIWEPDSAPMREAADSGAALLLNISASPYHKAKGDTRAEMLADRATTNGCAVALCALVGGQDELVFDGQSLLVDSQGEVQARSEQFAEDLLLFEIFQPEDSELSPTAATDLIAKLSVQTGEDLSTSGLATQLDPIAEAYAAICLGLRDYTFKNGFDHVVFGLSGGIDSALTACLARDALGADRVSVVVMPSPHSADETQQDARDLAAALGIQVFEFPIAGPMQAYGEVLSNAFSAVESDVTEENLQARIRGNLVMALSNKFGWLALSTGNKSEYSVGYATLYGDMAGGLAVLKDVPKTLVFELARWRNRQADAPIPQSTIDRPPSAELRPDQKDTDSLPPYDLLDQVLELYVEQDLGREAIVARGFDAAAVESVIALVDRAEYKRRQAPPGVKITPKAFGRDRRMPITNRFGG